MNRDNVVPLVGVLVTLGMLCSTSFILGGPLALGAFGVLLTGAAIGIAWVAFRQGGGR